MGFFNRLFFDFGTSIGVDLGTASILIYVKNKGIVLNEPSVVAMNQLTHEIIANHLGTHREVVTRMLRYFQSEGMVRLSRGTVELLSREKLEMLRDA